MGKFGNNGENQCLAVIGDISSSRKLPDRARTQNDLERAMTALNTAMKDRLASKFVVTLGDEFQGLLRSPSDAMDVLFDLEGYLNVIPVRYGIGWGPLTTELKEFTIGMDGPCFHNARDALNRGKKERRWVTVIGFGEEEDRILNGILSLMGAVREGWTETQALTVTMARRSKIQKEVAKKLGVVPSVVSESLTAANYSRFRESEASLSALLELFSGRTEQGHSSAERAK